MWFDAPHLRRLIDLALQEDVGAGDHATLATVDPGRLGFARVRAKSAAVVCGGPVFALALRRFDPGLDVTLLCEDGARVDPGAEVAHVHGKVASILTAERTALNFLQRLSGIATQTQAFVAAVARTNARIADTRKTLPGFRALDKYAVRVGGGVNHRSALDAGILVKENHTAMAGGVQEAVRKAKALAPHLLKVEVEVESLADLEAALQAGAEVVLLDNMAPDQLREAVRLTAGRAVLEASGNVTLHNVRAIAETGVDLISVGGLTHSVTAADFSLRLDP